MFFPRILAFSLLATVGAFAESHTVTFVNDCGFGTPQLVQDGNVLSTGGAFTSNGPLIDAIAFLQTGACNIDGAGCTTVEMTLQNSGPSAADISLIPPHAFSVTTGFGFTNGCDGAGADCTSASCTDAFHTPTDNFATVVCPSPDVNIVVTFCD